MSKVLKALIPVRSGSERVQNKNIRPFANSNLLEIKIKQLKKIKELDGIVVNSNNDEMLSIARELGVETVKRNDYYAQSNVSANEMFKNVAENCNADVIMYSNVTSPMIESNTISNIIKCYWEQCHEYDSVNTAHLIKEFLWKNNKPINYSITSMPRSQDLPNIMALNFAINLIERKKMIELTNYVSHKPYLYLIDKVEAIDIDDMVDFEFAEFMYKKLRMGE